MTTPIDGAPTAAVRAAFEALAGELDQLAIDANDSAAILQKIRAFDQAKLILVEYHVYREIAAAVRKAAK